MKAVLHELHIVNSRMKLLMVCVYLRWWTGWGQFWGWNGALAGSNVIYYRCALAVAEAMGSRAISGGSCANATTTNIGVMFCLLDELRAWYSDS
jgi:uncharacterized membrane protein YbhN (UPF0104 family)